MEFSDEVLDFFKGRKIVLVMTLDEEGRIHSAVKGIVQIERAGKIAIVDLYCGKTLRNLQREPRVSVTAIDEERFIGYTLQGKAKIIPQWEIHENFIEKWQDHIVARISERVISSVRRGRKSKEIFEAHFPQHPKHLIEIEVENIINLSVRLEHGQPF